MRKGGPPAHREGILAPFLRDSAAPPGVNQQFTEPETQDEPWGEEQMPRVAISAPKERRVGPLGTKDISPEVFQRAVQTAHAMHAQSGDAVVVRPDHREQVPAAPADAENPALELVPSQMPADGERAPENEETKKEEEPKSDPAALSLFALARSGTENQVSPTLARDPEYMRTLLWKSSPARKKWIEAHCESIDRDRLFTSGDIRQRVLLWSNPRVSVCFRTMTGSDEYWIRRLLRERYGESDSELELGFVILVVAGGVVDYGPEGRPQKWPEIPSSLQPQKDLQDRQRQTFEDRVQRALAIPYPLLTDLAINYAWFTERVQRDQREEDLGNG